MNGLIGFVLGVWIATTVALIVGSNVTPDQFTVAEEKCFNSGGLSHVISTENVDIVEFVCEDGTEGEARVRQSP